MLSVTEWITHVPIEVSAGGFVAAGVRITCDRGHLPDRLYVALAEALSAKAAHEGVNTPVGLDPGVWLRQCRRCARPFIDLPKMRLCSDRCRLEAKRDAAARSKTKRAGRHESRSAAKGQSFFCAQCGQRSGSFRRTKQFCSPKCRVAAHRGAERPLMSIEELDSKIADARSVLGAFAVVGCNDTAFLRNLMERVLAMQAQRAALAQRDLVVP
jgi:hypothetical protein